MTSLPPRLALAALPTPLIRLDRLSAAWDGPTVWAKRDDLTGFELSGNKVRKLEFHLAAARDAGATSVITCGALQSNHCRATALAAAQTGFACTLFIRTNDGLPPDEITGNHLLHRLSGARIVYITPEQYRHERNELMASEAESAGGAWVIPEGASDALGMWGFVLAMRELADQMTMIPGPVAAVWHASSSGGTTAGLGWGADRLGLDVAVVGSSVGDPVRELRSQIETIWAEAADRWGGRPPEPNWQVTDDYIGRGYALTTPDELALQAEATALTGMLFDPAYTGKAIFGLSREIRAGRFGRDDHVVFWHTGGGFAAFAHDWRDALAPVRPIGD